MPVNLMELCFKFPVRGDKKSKTALTARQFAVEDGWNARWLRKLSKVLPSLPGSYKELITKDIVSGMHSMDKVGGQFMISPILWSDDVSLVVLVKSEKEKDLVESLFVKAIEKRTGFSLVPLRRNNGDEREMIIHSESGWDAVERLESLRCEGEKALLGRGVGERDRRRMSNP